MERWNIHVGDCLSELRKIKPESVQTVVTSPPYWGLRDYGTASWEGGSDGCKHKPVFNPSPTATVGNDIKDVGKFYYRDRCRDCGAKRIDDQIGIEPTPQEYVMNMVNLFKEIKRVLKKDGTVWLNLGDSYSSGSRTTTTNDTLRGDTSVNVTRTPVVKEIKPKDLVGIPWRVAFALQEDGWYLRSDIIWHKPNPMPESVTDRPTKSHEYIFLLSKSPHYYYDADAIRDPTADSTKQIYKYGWNGNEYRDYPGGGKANDFSKYIGSEKSRLDTEKGANKRSVWSVNTKSFPESHFATFPEKLIDTCIKAGSKENDIVLDPFSGAGTTGVVACKLNRTYIGIELNPEYAEMSKNRLARTVGATEEQSKKMESDAVQGFLL